MPPIVLFNFLLIFRKYLQRKKKKIYENRYCYTQIYLHNLTFSKFFFLFPVCNQFSRGVYSMLGAVSPDSFDTLHSYSNTFQMPFVTPWFPEKVKKKNFITKIVFYTKKFSAIYYRNLLTVCVIHFSLQKRIFTISSSTFLITICNQICDYLEEK